MKLYIDYLSQPSRAVLWLCRMNALPVEVVEVRIGRMEQRSEEFARLNPMKQVPVLEDVRRHLRPQPPHSGRCDGVV